MKNGGTKAGELARSVELVKEIAEDQGLYFALMFLLDSEYGRDEIGKIATLIGPPKAQLAAPYVGEHYKGYRIELEAVAVNKTQFVVRTMGNKKEFVSLHAAKRFIDGFWETSI